MTRKITLLILSVLFASTAGYSQYCSAVYTNTTDDWISNVTFAGINNNSGSVGYEDFTSIIGTVSAGITYPISVTVNTANGTWTQYLSVFIDWNQDQIFQEASERYNFGFQSISGSYVFTGSITVPGGALPGSTRMRVMEDWNNYPPAGGCVNTTYGETEDYTLFIAPPSLTAFVAQDTVTVPCYGDSSETLAAQIFGGQPPYSFDWSTSSNDSALFNMPAGVYTLTVTDDTNATDTAYFVVLNPDSMTLSTSVTQNLICDYDESAILASGSGGTPHGSYAWDTNSTLYEWDSTAEPIIIPLTANNSVSGPLDIGFDFEFFGNTYDEFVVASNGFLSFDLGVDNGCCDGDPIPNLSAFEPRNSIYAIWDYYTAAASTYSYFTTGVAPTRRTVVNFEGLPICCGSAPELGHAQIILHEGSNCIEIQTEFFNAPGFGSQTQGIQNSTGTEAYTYPGRNGVSWSSGESYISFCPSDTNGLIYTWSNGYVGDSIVGLPSGTHTVTVSDFNGCEKAETVVLAPALSALTSNLEVSHISCFGENDGMIDPNLTGGANPISYTWSNNDSSSTLSNLGPGTYSVYAEDNLNCTIEVNNVVIESPTLLIAAISNSTDVLCPGDTTGAAMGVASGGRPPYTYTWDPLNVSGQSISGVSDGVYNMVVTDSSGCQTFKRVAIVATSFTPVVDLGPDLFSAEDASFILDADTHSSYIWSDNSTGQFLTVTASGTYAVTVANNDGCTASDEVVVEIWPTGIHGVTNSNVSIYPNPTSGLLNVDVKTAGAASILDISGKVIRSDVRLNVGVNTLNLSELAVGMYSLQIQSDNGTDHVQFQVTK